MVNLSYATEQKVRKLFKVEDQQAVIELLEAECGDNLPLCKGYDSNKLERIRFAALKISDGDLAKMEKAVNLAKRDWRDLLVGAGFGHDVNAHTRWDVS